VGFKINKVKLLSTAVAFFAFFLTATSYAQSKTGKEYQAVIETAYNYFNGAANGDQKLLSKAFDLEFGHVKMIMLIKKQEVKL